MSAIERRRASVVCVHAGRLLCVQLRDPTTRVARLFVPGGAIETGETPAQTAARETLEETGYRVRIQSEHERIARYPFTWDGRTFAVTTHFFAASLLDAASPPHPVADAAYHEGVVWLELAQVPAAMSFETTMLTAITALLAEMPGG